MTPQTTPRIGGSFAMHAPETPADRITLTKAPIYGQGRGIGDRWALGHTACVTCGLADLPHKAFGLCRSCYDRRRKAAERMAA